MPRAVIEPTQTKQGRQNLRQCSRSSPGLTNTFGEMKARIISVGKGPRPSNGFGDAHLDMAVSHMEQKF